MIFLFTLNMLLTTSSSKIIIIIGEKNNVERQQYPLTPRPRWGICDLHHREPQPALGRMRLKDIDKPDFFDKLRHDGLVKSHEFNYRWLSKKVHIPPLNHGGIKRRGIFSGTRPYM